MLPDENLAEACTIASLAFAAATAGAQSVPVNPVSTPTTGTPGEPPSATDEPAGIADPAAERTGDEPDRRPLGVKGSPGALPNSGTGPSRTNNNADLFVLAGLGLALVGAGVATRRFRLHKQAHIEPCVPCAARNREEGTSPAGSPLHPGRSSTLKFRLIPPILIRLGSTRPADEGSAAARSGRGTDGRPDTRQRGCAP